MGRPPVVPAPGLGTTLHAAMKRLGLKPQEVAAAARVNKGTLYKILSGETTEPRSKTVYALCKVLRLDIAQVLGAEQLELMARSFTKHALSQLEQLLVSEVKGMETPDAIKAAVEVAILAILEVKLGVGHGPGRNCLAESRATAAKDTDSLLDLLVRQLRQVPEAIQPTAVRAAIGACIDLKLIANARPSRDLYRAMHTARHKRWARRRRPVSG